MGLDMYLDAEILIFDGVDDNELELRDIAVTRALAKCGFDMDGFEEFNLTGVTFEVCYWRKANHIHGWFVENVQEGNDDCREYSVSHKQLKELRDLADDVIEGRKEPEDALPVTEGTFYGPDDYGDWYFDELKATRKCIDDALAIAKNDFGRHILQFTYRSSW